MRIGLICPEVPGHLHPMTSLGGELVRRGHTVTLFAPPSAQKFADKNGLQLAPIGAAEDASGENVARWRRLAESTGFASMRETGRLFYELCRITFRDLPPALSELHLDGLIVDQFSPAAVVVARKHNLPFVIACNALASHFDLRLPPPPMPWKFRDNWFTRARNALAKYLIPPIYNRYARVKEIGVSPLMLVFEFDHGLAHIAQQPEFFDFPRNQLPAHFHYTAPWHRIERDDEVSFPWDRLDGRPLIYASMGTLQNRLEGVFKIILEAATSLPAQFVLTFGGSGYTLDREIPENVLPVPIAPQLRLLERASLAITHAGLNTVLECIGQAVPMLCLPVTNDQPGVARRAEWLGIAKMFSLGVRPQVLRSAIVEMLENQRYHESAKQYQQKVRAQNGLTMASTIIEKAFTTGQVVLR